MNYVVDIGYPLTGQTADELMTFDNKVIEVTGCDSLSSGGGFGIRDHQFYYNTFDQAKQVADKLNEFFEKEFGPKHIIGYFEANPDLPHYNWYVGVYEEEE